MPFRSRRIGAGLLVCAALVPLQAATVSRQNADAFAQKIVQIQQQGSQALSGDRRSTAQRRTAVTEDELNSWFAYRAQPVLPAGVTQPQITIVGEGKVAGQATVDLEAIGKRRSTGGTFDPWSYLGGRVPVTINGILHTQNGRGRFEVQNAEVSGVSVPTNLLQELVSYYSRTPDNPGGISLDEAFELPANIDKIEVGQGQAVVIQ
ncbi:MAG TPA: hypothetical protein VIX63_04200 [Vicinamibacterales bacterium]